MQYREFGKTGVKVSPIGFGMMRLPSDNEGNVNEAEAIRIVREAIDNGLNYVDTVSAMIVKCSVNIVKYVRQ